ncbi:MAG: GNAT family N-acetyltransferase [Hyphomicrobiaceae bacterium]
MADDTDLSFKPLTPKLMDDLGVVLKGSWGATCWCMFPRLTDKQMKELPGDGAVKDRRRAAMTKLARRRSHAPGLVAFDGNEPVGWAALGPRPEFIRVDKSKATPPVDETPVWIIPCITVRKTARGQGIAVALIKAATAYAFERGAATVEAYPRADDKRTGADNIFFGTEPLFRRAGFEVVRGPIEGRPKNWIARVAMRAVP